MLPRSTTAPLSEARIRRWIRGHEVCWESLPHRELWRGRLCAIGYDVILAARAGSFRCGPGGKRALCVFRRLEQLASRVLPQPGPTEITVGRFEPTFQLRPETHFRPEVSLVVNVRHHTSNYFGPIDAQEIESTRHLEDALSKLGAQSRTWQPPRKPVAGS
jgi:hypothetical protein